MRLTQTNTRREADHTIVMYMNNTCTIGKMHVELMPLNGIVMTSANPVYLLRKITTS